MTYAIRLIPTFVFATMIAALAVADVGEQCRAFRPFLPASNDKFEAYAVSEEVIKLFIKTAGIEVKVEDTYEIVTRVVRARVFDLDPARYDKQRLNRSVWRQVLFMQCVIVRQSESMTEDEKSDAIDALLAKKSLSRPPALYGRRKR